VTPAEARRLYLEARTIAEVTSLLGHRGRAAERRLVLSIESLFLSAPPKALAILRGCADDDAGMMVELKTRLDATPGPYRREPIAEKIRDREARIAALRWAATALTRGMAFGPCDDAKA
jgi:hypothetical protein